MSTDSTSGGNIDINFDAPKTPVYTVPSSGSTIRTPSDANTFNLPRETFIALLQSVGGCIVLDEADLLAVFNNRQLQVEVVEQYEPRKLTFKVIDLSELHDPL